MNDETYKERCDEILLSRGKLIKELIDLGYDITTLDFKINKLNLEDEEATKVNQYLLEYFKSNL